MAKVRCARCGEEKFKKDFSLNPRNASGVFSWCKQCKAEYQQEIRARQKEEYPELEKKNRQRLKLLSRYGISLDTYEDIAEVQGYVCAGCGRPPPPGKSLAVDHEHQPDEKNRQPWERSYKVRGLLCWKCNRLIGLAYDDPATLRRLADYLENPPARPIMLRIWENVASYLEDYESRKPKK